MSAIVFNCFSLTWNSPLSWVGCPASSWDPPISVSPMSTMPSFCTGTGNLNCVSHVCTASTPLAVQSLQSLHLIFEKTYQDTFLKYLFFTLKSWVGLSYVPHKKTYTEVDSLYFKCVPLGEVLCITCVQRLEEAWSHELPCGCLAISTLKHWAIFPVY